MRFLFAWEQGANLGHVSVLLPIARILKERGHHVLFAVKELATAAQLLDAEGFRYVQSPVAMGIVKSRREAASFADVLAEGGFGDAGVLGAMIRAWKTIFDLSRPDVVLSQHAPTVIQAARIHGIPCLKLALGFESPPETAPYPCFRPWLKLNRDQLLENENRLLVNVNQVRRDFGVEELSRLYQAVRADVSLQAVMPELAYYPDKKARCIGPLFMADEGQQIQWSGLCAKRIFAYVRPAPETAMILELFEKSGAEVVAFIPGIAETLMQKYSNQRMRIITSKAKLSGLLPNADLTICNANLATVSASLLSGVPCLCIPTHIEQLMVSCNLERLGAGRWLRRDQIAKRFESTLIEMLDNDSYMEKARGISRKYADYDQSQVYVRLANTLERMKTDIRSG